jgi:hypothetical protein
MDVCLIFVPFGHYDEPEILPYENPSMCPRGADVRQIAWLPRVPGLESFERDRD